MRPFDANGVFVDVAKQGGFRKVVSRSAGVTVLSGVLAVIVQTVATVVLGRLLTPSDFGLMAMVTTFSMLLMNIGLNGFTEAVVQRETIDHQLISNLFWINATLGLVLAIGFAAGAPFLAWFYREPRLTHLAAVMSLVIFFNCISVLHLALLKRAMKFTKTSAIEISVRGAAVLAGVVLAWAGWGYWALAVAAVVTPLATSIAAFALCPWLPGWPRRAEGTGSIVRFSLNVYGRYSVNYFGMNVDQLLLGWRFNAQALGFYKKAYDLFFLSAVLSVWRLRLVAVAALSRLNRDPVQYERYLLNALGIVAFLAMAVGGGLTLAGGDVIRILLGPKWETSGRIMTWFGFGAGMMLIHELHGWIHLSLGRADRWFRWGILELAIHAVLFVLALRWGPIGIASAWTVSFWILTIPAIWYAGKPINLGIAPIVEAIWRPVVASASAGWAAAAILRSNAFLPAGDRFADALIRMTAVCVIFVVLYVAATIILHRGFAPLQRTLALVRDMVPHYGSTRTVPQS